METQQIAFLEAHDKKVIPLSSSTVKVLDTYYSLREDTSFDSLLTKRADGKGYHETLLMPDSMVAVCDPVHYNTLKEFLGY